MPLRFQKTLIVFVCLFAAPSTFALPGGELSDFQLSTCNKAFCAVVSGKKGSLSFVGDLLASERVTVEITKSNGTKQLQVCDSFIYDFALEYSHCDLQKGAFQRWVIDLANSELRYL